jgi:6-phosphogluconate dehydrogenase
MLSVGPVITMIGFVPLAGISAGTDGAQRTPAIVNGCNRVGLSLEWGVDEAFVKETSARASSLALVQSCKEKLGTQ